MASQKNLCEVKYYRLDNSLGCAIHWSMLTIQQITTALVKIWEDDDDGNLLADTKEDKEEEDVNDVTQDDAIHQESIKNSANNHNQTDLFVDLLSSSDKDSVY